MVCPFVMRMSAHWQCLFLYAVRVCGAFTSPTVSDAPRPIPSMRGPDAAATATFAAAFVAARWVYKEGTGRVQFAAEYSFPQLFAPVLLNSSK